MPTIRQRDFCRQVYHAAERINEIDPLFVAAQACLESGWGKSIIGKYNCFGITKGTKWNGKCVLVKTTEFFGNDKVRYNSPESVVKITKLREGKYRYTVYRLFKDFSSWDECLREYTRLYQKPGYADAWPYRKNAREFARRIIDNKGCRYATDPNYSQTMTAMISSVEKVIRA